MTIRELAGQSVILLCQDANISILRAPWLAHEGILTEEELSGDEVVFGPGIVKIETPGFGLFCLPDRLQLSLRADSPSPLEDVLRVLGGIARVLPHTPFRAAGINFEYHLRPEDEGAFEEWNQAVASNALTASLASDAGSPRFGFYYSAEVLGFRLKVDAKPAQRTNGEGPELVAATFNFHRDITEINPGQGVQSILAAWPKCRAYADGIVETVSKWKGA